MPLNFGPDLKGIFKCLCDISETHAEIAEKNIKLNINIPILIVD